MPVKSAKQFRLFEAAVNNKLKGVGPPPSVASEFLSKTPHSVKSNFAKENKFTSAFKKRKKSFDF